MQLYAINFIPLLDSLYMFRAFYTHPPSSGVQFLTVSTATGTNHSIVSATCSLEQVAVTILWFVPVAVDTVEHCTPDDGCVWRPKHVE